MHLSCQYGVWALLSQPLSRCHESRYVTPLSAIRLQWPNDAYPAKLDKLAWSTCLKYVKSNTVQTCLQLRLNVACWSISSAPFSFSMHKRWRQIPCSRVPLASNFRLQPWSCKRLLPRAKTLAIFVAFMSKPRLWWSHRRQQRQSICLWATLAMLVHE